MSITAMRQAVEAVIEEIEAIDCYHHGDPSYEHCPYTIRARAANIVKKHRQALVAIADRYLDVAINEAEKQEPCPYCNDSGDVHSFDGEWRGRCTCPAGQPAPKQEPVGRIAGNGYPELYKPHSLPAWTLLYLAAGAQTIPAGYQLVPVEPTDKMVQASLHLDLSYMPLQEGYDRAAVYKAMLAAAPVQAQPAKPLTPEQSKALTDARNEAMFWMAQGRIPECGPFGHIAQNLDWLCDQLGVEKAHNIKEQP